MPIHLMLFDRLITIGFQRYISLIRGDYVVKDREKPFYEEGRWVIRGNLGFTRYQKVLFEIHRLRR